MSTSAREVERLQDQGGAHRYKHNGLSRRTVEEDGLRGYVDPSRKEGFKAELSGEVNRRKVENAILDTQLRLGLQT